MPRVRDVPARGTARTRGTGTAAERPAGPDRAPSPDARPASPDPAAAAATTARDASSSARPVRYDSAVPAPTPSDRTP